MKYLVTGASGFVGGKLAERLLKDFGSGDNAFIFLAHSRSTPFLEKCESDPRVTVVRADIGDIDSIAPSFAGVDHVFHAAAKVKYGCRDTSGYYRTNVEGSRNVFELCMKYGVKRVIYLSSAGIFHPAGNRVVNETTPLVEQQSTRYTHSKYLAYLRVQEYIRKGTPIITILPSAVFGEGSPLFTPFLRDIERRIILPLPPLTHPFSLVYVDDLVEGIMRAFRRGVPGESYAISGQSLTVKKMVDMAAAILCTKTIVIPIPHRIAEKLYAVTEAVGKLSNTRCFYTRELHRYMSGGLLVDHSKAERDLGYRGTNFHRNFERMVMDACRRNTL
jgi:nucleoside-diphosphate-sugar epimerase